jgi:GNAT superfamily N-acetyltransferase
MSRRAETDADLAGWCDVWTAITPREPITVKQVRQRLAREPERLYLVAEADGSIVGAGFAGPSQSPGRIALAVRVLPEHRRRGIGSALYERVVAHAQASEPDWVSGMVEEDDLESLSWTERRGFEEYGRQVELSRMLNGRELPPSPPAGIEIRELRDDHVSGAYAVAVECYPDMPTATPIPAAGFDQWRDEELDGPVTFVALDGGEVIGYAALLDLVDGVAEHGLTAVQRAYRGRGVATALKQALIHWAAEHGYRELTTWTQDRNAAMQAVNLKLGYKPRPAIVNVRRRP